LSTYLGSAHSEMIDTMTVKLVEIYKNTMNYSGADGQWRDGQKESGFPMGSITVRSGAKMYMMRKNEGWKLDEPRCVYYNAFRRKRIATYRSARPQAFILSLL
jgi:hypothetical protein